MSATIGGVIWLVLVLWPLPPQYGIGLIEKLFLLAPLVIVPLGLELVGAPGGRALPRTCAAFMVVASFFVERGRFAAALMAPWFVVLAAAGLEGLRRLIRGAWREPHRLCEAAALLMLPVGGVGLMQSRLGLSPLGYREPVVLLVAVHFHYAAFVSPLMASRVVGKNWLVALAASVGSPLLAAGYVLFLPWVRLVGATLLVLGLFGVSAMTLLELSRLRSLAAQVLLAVSAISVLVAMTYASVYALADFLGEVWVAIPHMARTHGVINALGFSVCGLLGWSVAQLHPQRLGRSRALQSLTRRWE